MGYAESAMDSEAGDADGDEADSNIERPCEPGESNSI
jgi:hypothetical protein